MEEKITNPGRFFDGAFEEIVDYWRNTMALRPISGTIMALNKYLDTK